MVLDQPELTRRIVTWYRDSIITFLPEWSPMLQAIYMATAIGIETPPKVKARPIVIENPMTRIVSGSATQGDREPLRIFFAEHRQYALTGCHQAIVSVIRVINHYENILGTHWTVGR